MKNTKDNIKDNTATIKKFKSSDEMINYIYEKTIHRLGQAIKEKGQASLVATGGTTVPPLLKQLSQSDIAWGKVYLTLSDERWVNPTNPQSNQYLIKNLLLQGKASQANFTPLWRDCHTCEEAVAISHEALKNMPLPFDVTLLGMGADMHFASLFPKALGVKEGMDTTNDNMVCKIGPVTKAAGAETRISLTLKALTNSKVIYIIIVGDEKLAAVTKAQSIYDPWQSPVSALLHQNKCPIEIFWAPKKLDT